MEWHWQHKSGWGWAAGGTPKADEGTDKLRECDSDKGRRRVQKTEKFADVT